MHAALACETERVQCGSLVYSIGYRHPAVLAKAITAIDLISGGRAAMGIGAGWAEVEYQAYGIEFPSIGTRMDQLEEGIAILRGLLRDDETTFEGTWFSTTGRATSPARSRTRCRSGSAARARSARCASPPASPTAGTCRSSTPATFAAKRDVLHRHCADVGPRPGRDPVRRQPRAGLDRGQPAPPVRRRWPTASAPACSAGPSSRSLDRIGEYVGRRRRPGQPGPAGAVRRRRARAVQRVPRPGLNGSVRMSVARATNIRTEASAGVAEEAGERPRQPGSGRRASGRRRARTTSRRAGRRGGRPRPCPAAHRRRTVQWRATLPASAAHPPVGQRRRHRHRRRGRRRRGPSPTRRSSGPRRSGSRRPGRRRTAGTPTPARRCRRRHRRPRPGRPRTRPGRPARGSSRR